MLELNALRMNRPDYELTLEDEYVGGLMMKLLTTPEYTHTHTHTHTHTSSTSRFVSRPYKLLSSRRISDSLWGSAIPLFSRYRWGPFFEYKLAEA